MTQIAIDKQIEVIEKVTAEVTKTKDAAKQFLIDAGIVAGDNKRSSDKK